MITADPVRPVVDLAVEGWARLARLRGWDDGQSLRRPDPKPVEGAHDSTCGCVACEGQLGTPSGVGR